MNGGDLMPFKAKGDRPEWRLIYDALLDTADYGDIITYQQLTDALGRDFFENRGPLYRARTEMVEARSRWIELEPGIGYRVIEANEHVRAAEAKRKRAQSQMKQMIRITNGTNLSRLSAAELEIYDLKSRMFATQYHVLMHEKRLQRIEGLLGIV